MFRAWCLGFRVLNLGSRVFDLLSLPWLQIRVLCQRSDQEYHQVGSVVGSCCGACEELMGSQAHIYVYTHICICICFRYTHTYIYI